MGCSCIPPPASLQPRKVYNILVPDVFPLQPPDPKQDLPKGVERKTEKLAEYLHKHPARTAKVSRRLTRRIKHALYTKQYGYIKIAVYAYKALLSKSVEEDSPFSFVYFAKELIEQPDAVISTLLSHPEATVKCYGAELLASYIKAQSPVQHQRAEVQPLVSAACTHARQRKDEALTLACLRAASEWVALCQQLRTLPPNLEDLLTAVLRILDVDSPDAGPSGGSTEEPDTATVPGLARSVLQKLKPFLQDISTVYRVMETLFKYLDQDRRWQQPEAVKRLMALVQSCCSDQPFPLFTALIRHSSAPGLGPDERAVVIGLALQQPSVYSLSALSLALQELPGALTADPHADTAQLRGTVRAAIRKLALEVGDAGQMCEAISSVLRQHPTPSRAAQACLQCALEAVRAIPSFPGPGAALPGGAPPGHLLQQLAAILAVWGPGEAEARGAAAEVLVTVLGGCGPGGLRDERGGLALMGLVLRLAGSAAGGSPGDAVTMDRVLAACLASRRPELLLHAVRMGRALFGEVLRHAPGGGGAVAAAAERVAAVTGAGGERAGAGDEAPDRSLWGVALLLLLNALLGRLAAAANCPHLLPLRTAVPPEACTSLREEAGALVSTSPVLAGSSSAAEGCLRALAAEWPADHWYGKVVDALCKGSTLQTHYMYNLQNIIFEPFAAHALPSLPAAQALAAMPSAGQERRGNGNGGLANGGAEGSGREVASNQLYSRLELMARSLSVRRERLNLQHVMDLLGDGEADGSGQAAERADRSAAATPAAAPGAALSVGEVLDAVAAFEAMPPALPGPGPLEMADLVQRLEAVTG